MVSVFLHTQKSGSCYECTIPRLVESKQSDRRSKRMSPGSPCVSPGAAVAHFDGARCLCAAATPTWVARVTPRVCPWTARAACTTAPSSTSSSTPSASTTSSAAPTGTITSACCGRTSSQVGPPEGNVHGCLPQRPERAPAVPCYKYEPFDPWQVRLTFSRCR